MGILGGEHLRESIAITLGNRQVIHVFRFIRSYTKLNLVTEKRLLIL